MRPYDKKPRSKSRAAARVRFGIQLHLGWLRGGPVSSKKKGEGLDWLMVPAPGEGRLPELMVVDRERMRRTAYQRNKLAREFPRALPEVVGDVERWRNAMDEVLEPLKAVLHEGQVLAAPGGVLTARVGPAVARRWRALRDAHPRLRGPIDRIAWQSEDRRGADRMLVVLEAHADRLATLEDPAVVAMLIELLAVDGPRATGLLEMITDADLDLVCDGWRWSQLDDSVAELQRRFAKEPRKPWPELPKRDGKVHRIICSWLETIYGLSAPARRQAYTLLKGLWPLDLGRRWARHVERIEKVRDQAEVWLASAQTEEEGYTAQLEKRSRTLRRLKKSPPPFVAPKFGENLLGLFKLQAEDRENARLLSAALKRVPTVYDGVLARMTLLCRWFAALQKDDVTVAILRDHLRRTARFLSSRDPQRALALWQLPGPEREGFGSLVMEDNHYPLDQPETRDRRWEILAGLSDGKYALGPELLRIVESIIWIEHVSAEGSLRVLSLIVDAGRLKSLAERNFERFRVSFQLSIEEPEMFLPLYDALRALDSSNWVTGEVARVVIPNQRSFLGEAILSGAASEVSQLALFATQGAKDDQSLVTLPWPGLSNPDVAWVRRYPQGLRAALRELAEIDPDAEAAAAAVLRRDFRDPQAIRREVRELAVRIAAGGPRLSFLTARRDRLQEALVHEPVISPRRMENYRAKLRARTVRAGLDRLAARVRRSETREMRRHLDAEAIAWCREEPRVRNLMPYILRLPPVSRGLAMRLLQARCGAPPWDLRDAPENLRYRQKMERRGLDLTAWLSAESEVVEGDNGVEISLALSPDPLEVLVMGKHFATCLAPSDFNFFSAVSNAADINKQVLYAHDSRGRVVGRRLLTLTSSGEMLIFEPYAHDGALGFRRVSDEFVLRLCKAMGTRVTASGDVDRILCHDWYDDGAHRLGVGMEWLADEGELAMALPDATPEEFLSMVERNAGGRLEPGQLRRVMHWFAAKRRGDLAPCLMRWLRDVSHPQTLCQAARLYRQAGLDGSVFLRQISLSRGLVRALSCGDLDDLVEEYVEVDPSLGLRLLRWTRVQGVKSWAEEHSYRRLFAAARAHEKMHRLRTALELYRASRRPRKKSQVCDERIRVLRKVLGDSR